MQQRTRKFVGAFAMLAFVIVYALVAMVLAQARPTAGSAGAHADAHLCRAWPGLDFAADAAHPLDGTGGRTAKRR